MRRRTKAPAECRPAADGDPDPFATLELPADADSAAVRRAYQRLARRHHPGLHPEDPGAAERFARIDRAYRELSGEPRGAQAPRWWIGQVRYRRTRLVIGGADRAGRAGRADDPWPSGAGGRAERVLDLEEELRLDFAQIVRGALVSITVQRERTCSPCGGGKVENCPRCAGRGEVVELDRVRARIPPGLEDGTRLRLRGKGRGGGEGVRGDLYLVLRIGRHPYFGRRGRDIHCEVPVTSREAGLGAEIDVPTIDGPVRVRLPAGTVGGQRFRLRGHGIRGPGDRRGDQLYRVRIVEPRGDRGSEASDVRRELPREPV